MANPYTNKVVVNDQTIIDLTNDTATASDVAQGKTFHLANGQQATGTHNGAESVTVNGETFTPSDGDINLGTLLRQHQSLAAYRTATAQDTIDAGKLNKSGGTMTGILDFGTQNYMAKTFGRNFLVCSGASGFLQVGATELRFKFQGSTQRPQYYSAVDAQNHDIALYEDVPQIQYSTTDIGEGAQLATGTFYFVYEE